MSANPAQGKPNRLINESSPYLLQHAYNPADWFPWGPEAFERAAAEDKPIFLSVGYSACHWCHVMERESFENPDIAALMNEYFINIKVDREERPDVDQIYMAAIQAMTRQGGWPMSVFLTPELKPFFGGTYFPPTDSRGMAGFPRVLLSVARAWKERREEIIETSGELTEHLNKLTRLRFQPGDPDPLVFDAALRALSKVFDSIHGGFGSAPKFPHPMDLRVLLRIHHRTGDARALHMVRHTLDKMARGGIHDHLGGGFARYSTDERWLVPHFEKMLYDNALLAGVYLEAYQVTKDENYALVSRDILDYVLERMTAPEGGFYSTEDADSEGVEGKYYVWSLEEILEILGEARGATFAESHGASREGNWEGTNILNLPVPIDVAAERLGRDPNDLLAELRESRRTLLQARDRRIPPGKDTKILASWNGLMIASLAEGSRILRDEKYLRAAEKACDFLVTRLRGESGRLRHSFKDGQAKFNAYLDDYSNLIDGLTRVFEAGGSPRFLESALELAEVMIREFADGEHAFDYTGRGHESLIARPKDIQDNATPSSNGMAAAALLRLASLTDRADFRAAGMSAIRAVEPLLREHPSAMGQTLIAADIALGPTREIAVFAGSADSGLIDALETIASRFDPNCVVAPRRESGGDKTALDLAVFRGRGPIDGRVTSYLCENSVCRAPVVGIPGLIDALRR